MSDLSPEAKAIWEASFSHPGHNHSVAAIIEELVEQKIPFEENPPETGDIVMETCRWDERQGLRREILAIAAELRGLSTSQED